MPRARLVVRMFLWRPENPENDSIDPKLVVRFTRMWLHYGAIAFVVACTVIGAVRGILER